MHLTFAATGAKMETGPLPYGTEATAAFAGPMMNLFLFFLTRRALPILALVNLGLFCFNLLPFYPLDGGRVLRCLLRRHFSFATSLSVERWCSVLGLVVLGLMAAYGSLCLRMGAWPLLIWAMIARRSMANTAHEVCPLFCPKNT